MAQQGAQAQRAGAVRSLRIFSMDLASCRYVEQRETYLADTGTEAVLHRRTRPVYCYLIQGICRPEAEIGCPDVGPSGVEQAGPRGRDGPVDRHRA